MLKVIMDDVRIKSVLERAEKVGLDGYAIIEKVGSFDNVEGFQSWKNGLDEVGSYVVARLGRNNYLKVRNAMRYSL
jgi:hypothetical protein